MIKGFEDAFTDLQSEFVSLCMEYTNGSVCIYRSDCHNCTDDLPHLAADCPRALPGKKRACLTSHQTGSCETHLMRLISFPDNQFHSHQVSL